MDRTPVLARKRIELCDGVKEPLTFLLRHHIRERGLERIVIASAKFGVQI